MFLATENSVCDPSNHSRAWERSRFGTDDGETLLELPKCQGLQVARALLLSRVNKLILYFSHMKFIHSTIPGEGVSRIAYLL